MKVAFWSNVHGQTGVTSNVIALALMAAIEKKKVALLQSHFVLNNMSKPLVGTDVNPEEFRDTGIDALIPYMYFHNHLRKQLSFLFYFFSNYHLGLSLLYLLGYQL